MKFSNNDINKFNLLLRKGVYPYGYMDDWEKFNETTLPKKEEFYSNLNMEYITDAGYIHQKRVCKDFEIKKLGEYHDLYLRVIHCFWLMFSKLGIRSCKISFSSWVSMASNFKKD